MVEARSTYAERRGAYRVLLGKPERKRRSEDSVLGGMITLRWIFRKWDVGLWTGLRWHRIGTGGGQL